MKNFLLTIFLLSTTIGLSDQTFVNESAILEEVYYGVPIDIEIVSHDVPTDFYVSLSSGTTWQQISSTWSWFSGGNSGRTFTWTPTFLASSLELGIHTGLRNSGTFSTSPTDISDEVFDVQASSITFNELPNIWYKDVFYLAWESNKNELPEYLELQYKFTSGTWVTIDTISSKLNGISYSNDNIKEDVEFRLTYLGNERGYNLGSVSSTYLEQSLVITNKSDIESVIWGDNQNITIEFDTERVSEYTYLTLSDGNNTLRTISHLENSITYTTADDFTGLTSLYFLNEDGDILDSVNIESRNKYFEISPLTGDNYFIGETIPFVWSFSDDYDLVKVEININSTSYTQYHNDWELVRNYNYSVRQGTEDISFRFTVNDGVTQIINEIGPIQIGNLCKADFYRAKADSLQYVIDNFEPEYIFSLIIRDIATNIEIEDEITVNSIGYAQIINDQIVIDSDNITHLYIVNNLGEIVYSKEEIYVHSNISVDVLNNGLFIIVYLENNLDVPKYLKLIK